MEKHPSCKWTSKESGVSVLRWDKIGFKTKTATGDEGHCHKKGDGPSRRSSKCKFYPPKLGASKYNQQLIIHIGETSQDGRGVGDWEDIRSQESS